MRTDGVVNAEVLGSCSMKNAGNCTVDDADDMYLVAPYWCYILHPTQKSTHPIKSTCSTTVLHPSLTWYSVHEDDDRGGGSDVIIVMWDSLPLISPIWDPYITNLPPVQSLYHLLSHRSEQSYYSYLCLARHLSTIYFMYSSIYGWEFVKLTTKAASLFNGSDLNLNWLNI